MREFKDVQSQASKISIAINKVGVKGVKLPIRIKRGSEVNNLVAIFDVFVDIPKDRKGADMSRAVESINTVALSDENHFSIEEIASKIGEEALRRFEYSTNAFVKLKTELFHRVKSESGKISVVNYPLTAEAIVERAGKTETSIEVEVTGINACPCAMETARTIIGNNNSKIDGMLDSIPGITHNQRNHVKIKLTVENDENIEAFELINSAEKVLGGSLLPVLKRIDEGEMVVRAHSNPMFVEDIVRFIVADIIKNKDISDNSKIEVSSESEESIHPHNAFATISGSIGEFRKNNSS